MDGKSKPQVRRRYEKTLLYANMVGIYPELPSRSRFSRSGITLALLAGFLIGMLFVSGCDGGSYTCRYENKEVAKVGGCSRMGNCGVRFTDGSYGELYKPVEGVIFEVKVCK